MLKRLLSLIGFAALGAPAVCADPPNVVPDASKIYPYVVPQEYLAHGPRESAEVTRELGHGAYIVLVHEVGDMVRNVLPEDLRSLGLSSEQAFRIGDRNLALLIQRQVVKSSVFSKGPSNKSFVLFGGHWAAATSLTWSELHPVLSRYLGAEEIVVSIPHREAMLAFPFGDAAHIAEVRSMVRKQESQGRKPITMGLFKLTRHGVVPYDGGE